MCWWTNAHVGIVLSNQQTEEQWCTGYREKPKWNCRRTNETSYSNSKLSKLCRPFLNHRTNIIYKLERDDIHSVPIELQTVISVEARWLKVEEILLSLDEVCYLCYAKLSKIYSVLRYCRGDVLSQLSSHTTTSLCTTTISEYISTRTSVLESFTHRQIESWYTREYSTSRKKVYAFCVSVPRRCSRKRECLVTHGYMS